MVETFNLCEGILWSVLGAILLWRSRKLDHPMHRLGGIGAITLFIFGVTDFIEVRTGAWWSPWWLLALKVLCVVILLWVGLSYRRARRLSSTS
ncbi:hypothetical protein ACFL2T_01230 [Elusimicrobiota bacterium]